MPTYVYGCSNTDHPTQEIKHGMTEDPTIACQVCGENMHRIPQAPLSIAFNPQEILTSWMNENYLRWRGKRRRFSPDLVKRPDKPIPATQAHTRRRVRNG